MFTLASPDGPGGTQGRTHIIGLKSGETIYGEGAPALYWFEVKGGVARTCRFHADGVRHITGFYYAGDVFGLDSGTFAETAEAVTDLTLIKHRRRDNGSDAEFTPGILHKALQVARRSIFLLGRRTAAERVAAFLLMIAKDHRAQWGVPVPMCRADIADHLGLTVHTVSRTISELTRRKLIALHGPQLVQIVDLGALRELAGISEAEDVLIEPRNFATAANQ